MYPRGVCSVVMGREEQLWRRIFDMLEDEVVMLSKEEGVYRLRPIQVGGVSLNWHGLVYLDYRQNPDLTGPVKVRIDNLNEGGLQLEEMQ